MLDDTPSNMVVFTSTTINMLSYEHWADLMLWIDAQKYKKINEDVYSFSATHPVYKPQYMNIGIMEQQDFDNITNRLFNKINKSTSNQKLAMLGKIDYYKNLYKDLKPSGDIELYRKQFATRFDRFATNQKQDWHNIFPYASTLVEKWNSK